MLNDPDEYGVYGKSTEERCECEVDDDAEVKESEYELKETAEDGGSDAESLLMRRRLVERVSEAESASEVSPDAGQVIRLTNT